MSCVSEKCKQRFKGVENFLRKVAFNLGNSPSQTEVKIISCIPIDVTDLQQKIISLEKELDEVKASKAEDREETIACCPNLGNRPETAQTACIDLCEGECMKEESDSEDSLENHCACCTHDLSMTNLYNQQMETETQCYTQGMFKRGKIKNALRKRGKCKTHLVYYAQAESSPFVTYQNQKRTLNNAGTEAKDFGISRTYITEMIQKQYAAVPIVKEFPVASQISSPVCRDVEPDQLDLKRNKYDSDICSCLHGAFQNIDNNPPNRTHDENNIQQTCSCNNDSNNTDFYDTSLYDMVPVKEKSVKPPHLVQDTPKRRWSPNADIQSTHSPEKNRQKYRYHSYNVNYSKTPAAPVIYEKKAPVKMSNKKEKHVRVIPNPKREEVMRELERNQEKNCSFDCGNVYVKRIHAIVKTPQVGAVREHLTRTHRVPTTISYKNAECLTNNVKDIDCQTTTSQSVQIDNELLQDDKKTDDTLNQIKVILQTVLTEVKTNTQEKKTSHEKSTKDAVVQKGLSQGMMPGCSTILNSFTYSPYDMNPFMASCSRHINPSAACYTHMPYASGKCLHNYPVFIQSPIRNMCSCYRNGSFVTKEVKTKNAATVAATNTDNKERTKETQKLIKEIYKSIKLNMDIPTKDTSASEYEGIKSTPRSVDVDNVREEGINFFMKSTDSKKPAQQTSTTPLINFNNKFTSNTMSLRSQIMSTTDTEKYLRNNRIESYLENLEAEKSKQNNVEEEHDVASPSTSEESSEDEGSDDVALPVQESEKKPKKRGIFSKMFKGPFKLFKSKPKKKEEEIQVENGTEDEESEAESDDYQTIYSQVEVDNAPRHIPYFVRNPMKTKAHSKISFSRHMRDRNQERHRSPYMEQEYRRQWNENLMFHDNPQRHSSEVPRSRESDVRHANPMYWRDYEARSALMGRDHNPRMVDEAITPSLPLHTRNKGVTLRIPKKSSVPKFRAGSKGLAWIKKHKPACGEQWKKIILES